MKHQYSSIKPLCYNMFISFLYDLIAAHWSFQLKFVVISSHCFGAFAIRSLFSCVALALLRIGWGINPSILWRYFIGNVNMTILRPGFVSISSKPSFFVLSENNIYNFERWFLEFQSANHREPSDDANHRKSQKARASDAQKPNHGLHGFFKQPTNRPRKRTGPPCWTVGNPSEITQSVVVYGF